MNDQYFYQDRGKTIGPIGYEDVKERIKDGRLKLFDLVFRDGEETWRMALEHATLRSEFKGATIASMKDRPWVCLQRKGTAELDFYTTGPFTTDEVATSLSEGRVSYSDYAWKDGFQDWKRLGALEEFNPRVRTTSTSAVPPVPEVPAQELLRNVVEFKRPTLPIPEAPPKEAKTPDLTKTDGPPPAPQPQSQTATVKLPPTPEAAPEKRKKKRARLAVDWGLVGVLVLVLTGVVIIVSRFALQRHNPSLAAGMSPALETTGPEGEPGPGVPTPVNENEPLAAPPAPDAAADQEGTATSSAGMDSGIDEPADTLAPVKTESKLPRELYLSVRAMSSNQARIEIRTDGSASFPVYVQVVGLPGQVSEGGAFYRFMRYIPTGNPSQPLDLSALKLPQGKFIVRVETGLLKREAKLTMGINDPLFKQAVVNQRKMWAHAIWRDRLTLFHLSQKLERQLAQGMVPTRKFSSAGLEPLIAVKRASGSKYFLFEEWWELHQITKDAKIAATPALLARTQKVRDRLATYTVWK